MGNASNQPSGYFEYTDTSVGDTWRISWEVTKNISDFTWTIKVKFYLKNPNRIDYGLSIKPKIQIGAEVFEGVYGTYGYSSDFVKLMEASRTIQCPPTGRSGVAIYGEFENSEGDSWTEVYGAITFDSFSGAWIKVNSQWKASMPWIKVNGQWKKARQYTKVNGQWVLSNQKWLWDPF